MKPVEELKKGFKVFVDKDNIINFIALRHEETPEDIVRATELVKESFEKIYKENPQKRYNILIDLLRIKRFSSRSLPSKARKVSYQISLHRQVRKTAFVSKSLIVKVLVGFIVTAARKGETVKWFSNRKKAIKWLKE